VQAVTRKEAKLAKLWAKYAALRERNDAAKTVRAQGNIGARMNAIDAQINEVLTLQILDPEAERRERAARYPTRASERPELGTVVRHVVERAARIVVGVGAPADAARTVRERAWDFESLSLAERAAHARAMVTREVGPIPPRGVNAEIDAKLDEANAHIRAGHLIDTLRALRHAVQRAEHARTAERFRAAGHGGPSGAPPCGCSH
jgi:hypothetical protein